MAFDHVSLAVESDDDLWLLKDRLEVAGFWVSEVIDHGFIRSIYSFDPNNIAIEFSTPAVDVDLRRRPQMLDKEPVAEATEGADPVSARWPRVTQPTAVSERCVYPGEGTIFKNPAPKNK